MVDSTLEVQDALVLALRADGDVTALVGSRTYDAAPQNPTYPLIEFGPRFSEPWEGSGMDGWESNQIINVWSEKPGAAEAIEIAAAVTALVHRGTLSLSSQAFVLGSLVGSNTIPQSDGKTTQVALRFQFLTHP